MRGRLRACDVPPSRYEQSEAEGRARQTVDAQQVWFALLESQMETGTPYMMFKDACNRKSNQRHLGTIRASNLCTEIVEYTAPDEVAVCNLASINLSAMVAGAGARPPSVGPVVAKHKTNGKRAGAAGATGCQKN